MAPDAITPLRTWTFRQVLRVSALAAREKWHAQAWQGIIHGVKPGIEPDFGLGSEDSRSRRPHYTKDHESHFETMKAEYRAKNCDPQGRKFPGTL